MTAAHLSAAELQQISEISAIRSLASQRMPEALRAWVDCDGHDRGLLANEDAWGQWALRPRVLVDISECDTRATILGGELSLPVVVAPFAGSAFCHPDAEVAIAQGALQAGTLMALSLRALRSPEEIQATGAPFWLHMDLKVSTDHAAVQAVIERAQDTGAQAICVTVDLPLFPPLWPPAMIAAMDESLNYVPYSGSDERTLPVSVPGNIEKLRKVTRSRATWSDIEWLRGQTDLPIVLKGVQTGEDATLACDAGVAGLIVSNHGGHASAETLGTAEILPEVVEAVDGRCDILVDGGIRSGADVLRALALGANAVMVGRCALWSVAIGGAAGVARAIGILHEQLRVEMALTGARSLAEVDRAMVVRREPVW